ncbi:hypothetical protein THAOC_28066 [Thalassiosira oceanica]|uniref:Uncharacterized protein n=1 Tax=Thalassiosira oceanica TaxID=159749 RepID=K0RUY3_THAOC|nr:hypothetical protein THAOC_28066 [Thalassiosira oceanica]|eukprot:EJK52641.1 hypothetical protein THAOC_28066 [Thalassiosira oceanica]
MEFEILARTMMSHADATHGYGEDWHFTRLRPSNGFSQKEQQPTAESLSYDRVWLETSATKAGPYPVWANLERLLAMIHR